MYAHLKLPWSHTVTSWWASFHRLPSASFVFSASWVGHFLTLLILFMTWLVPFSPPTPPFFWFTLCFSLFFCCFDFSCLAQACRQFKCYLLAKLTSQKCNFLWPAWPSMLPNHYAEAIKLAVSRYNQVISRNNSIPFFFSWGLWSTNTSKMCFRRSLSMTQNIHWDWS